MRIARVMLSLHRSPDSLPAPVVALRWLARAVLAPMLYGFLTFTLVVSFLLLNHPELLRRVAILHLRYALRREVSLQAVALDLRGRVALTGLKISDRLGSTTPAWTARQIDIRFDPAHLMAFPKKPAGALRQVTVDYPTLVIARDRAGAWNFDDLLKKKSTNQDRFQGELLVRHGEITYQDALGWGPRRIPINERVTDATLRLAAATKGYLPFRFSAKSATGSLRSFDASGSIRQTSKEVLCTIQLGTVQLPTVRHYLPEALPLTLTAGTADGRLQISLLADPATGTTTPHLTLVADIRQARGAWRVPAVGSYALDDVSGQLRYADDTLELVGMRGAVGGVSVQADGTLAHLKHPTLAVQLALAQVPTSRVVKLIPALRDLPMTLGGRTTGWVQLLGALDGLEVRGHLSGPSVQAQFGTLTELDGDLAIDSDSVEITSVRARGFGGGVTGHVWIRAGADHGPMILFTGEASRVSAHQVLAQYLPDEARTKAPLLNDLDGTLSGPVTVEVSADERVTVTTQARGMLALPDVTGGDVEGDLRLEIAGARATTQVERLHMTLPEGTFQLRGTISPDLEADLDVRGSALALDKLAALAGQRDISGTGYANGRLEGPLERPTFTGKVALRDGRMGERAFDALQGEVTAALGETPTLALRNLRVMAGGSRLALPETRVAMDPTHKTWRAEGAAVLPRTEVAALGAVLGVKLPLDGLVEGEATFDVTSDMPSAGGTLTLRSPVLHTPQGDLPLDSAKASFTLDGSALVLTQGELVYQGLPVALAGRVTLDPESKAPRALSLNVEARHIDPDTFTELVESDDPALGQLTKAFRVRVPLDIDGAFDLDATLTARLDGKDPGQRLTETLQATAMLRQTGVLRVGGVPYDDVLADVAYRADTRTLTFRQLNLTRLAGERGYRLTLAETGDGTPATMTLPARTGENPEIDLALAFGSKDFTGGKFADDPGADLEQLRRDLLFMLADAGPNTPLAQTREAVTKIQRPFAGHATMILQAIGVSNRPSLTARLNAKDLLVGDNTLPNITGTLYYETAQHLLTIQEDDPLMAKGGPDPDASALLFGTISLPQKDQAGRYIGGSESYPMNLHFEATNVDPALLGLWMRNAALKQVRGNTVMYADIRGTTANPEMEASLEIYDLGYGTVPFDRLNAIVSLKDDRIYIGRRELGGEGASTLQFHRAGPTAEPQALEFYGYLPITWNGPLQPTIPMDQPISLTFNLPKQGLDLVKAYLPQVTAGTGAEAAADGDTLVLGAFPRAKPADPPFVVSLPTPPKDAGSVEGSLQVTGTLAQPQIVNGVFRASAGELRLPVADTDLPNRIRDINIDLAFSSAVTGRTRVNEITVNDLSAVYLRAGDPPAKKVSFAWLRKLLGNLPKTATFTPGAIVAEGSIQLRLQEDLPSLRDIPGRLRYDLYAKMVRTPLRYRSLFQGTVTSYLHLGNRPETGRPLLTGVLYAENGLLTFAGGPTGAMSAPRLPFNPELQLAVQLGKGNRFEISPDNPFYKNSFSVDLPFQPTPLFTPISQADLVYAQSTQDGQVAKPPIARDHFAFTYTADTLKPYAAKGTGGWITGTLSRPELGARFTLAPGKARVQLPGGLLTMQETRGELKMALFSDEPPTLVAKARATGRVDKYGIEMTLDGNILQSGDRFPVAFATTSSPPGAPPLTSDEIQLRLARVGDIASLLQGDSPVLNSLSTTATTLLARDWFSRLARGIGLETLDISFDNTMTPDVTLVTPELTLSRYGSVQIGTTRTLADPPTWKLWLDYNMPDIKFFRNLSLSADVNERNERNLNLKYKWEF